ncbi:MAG: hypothetical protein ABI769_17525 [Pseudomonadota bacterium]
MFLDILGIIVGFVTIVLLLSILVTALVQTAANLMRRRHKALALGVVETDIAQKIENLRAQIDQGDKNASQLIDLVVATVAAAKTDPRVTWLEDKDVITPLIEAKVPESGVAVARHVLDRTRRIMEDKYLQWSRGLTVAASVIVALWFGASAPELFERLRTDSEFRARAEAMGERLAKDAPDEYRSIIEGTPGLRARTLFLEAHPEYTVQLGALRFEALAVDDLVGNFETAMDSEPRRDELAEEFRKLVEKELALQSERSLDAAKRSIADLSSVGIQPLENMSYYFDKNSANERVFRWDRLFGVLFMAVLMSFGAPFWYRMLKDVVGLKDALRKKEPPAPVN